MKFAVLSILMIMHLLPVSNEDVKYCNRWAIKMRDDHAFSPDQIAAEFGFRNLGEVIKGSSVYEFLHEEVTPVSSSKHEWKNSDILAHPSVESATQQMLQELAVSDTPSPTKVDKSRNKRSLTVFNDPLWPDTWHLNPKSTTLGMNIQEAWQNGLTGSGVTVVHLDNGIDYNHPDLLFAYDPSISLDLSDGDKDPYSADEGSSHGTKMAGLVAAAANNSVCSVGVAFQARIGMIRQFAGVTGSLTDIDAARSFTYNNEKVDIYVKGNGPGNYGRGAMALGELERLALTQGAESGRAGKGFIYVYPTGNGGVLKDSCALAGGVNSIYTLAISAAGERGTAPGYGENCSAVIASTYGSGNYPDRYMVTTDVDGECTRSFTGTSSSVAVAGGVMALLLEANPNLTWRDVQHLVIRNTRPPGELDPNASWIRNGAGRMYSASFGYGLMDVGSLTKSAKTWVRVPEQVRCIVPSQETSAIRVDPGKTVSSTVSVRDCEGMRYLEHVLVNFTASVGKRGDIELVLISPSGTRSQLLTARPFDFSPDGFSEWSILSMTHWEEVPDGDWTLQVVNAGKPDSLLTRPLSLHSWQLTLYGTVQSPD